MTEVKSMLFVLENFNVSINHPAPAIRIAANVRTIGCEYICEVISNNKFSKKTGSTSAFVFETLSFTGFLYTIGQSTNQIQ